MLHLCKKRCFQSKSARVDTSKNFEKNENWKLHAFFNAKWHMNPVAERLLWGGGCGRGSKPSMPFCQFWSDWPKIFFTWKLRHCRNAFYLYFIKKDFNFLSDRYPQVFETKHQFINNLSILDLIFNLGPQSLEFLERQNLPNFNF